MKKHESANNFANHPQTRKLVFAATLLTLEILFLTVPFLQIELGAFTIVFSALPIAVAAIVFGLPSAVILGIAWGTISFSQAFTDSFGMIMLERNFIGTFLTLGVSRIMVGVCTYYVFTLLRRTYNLNNLTVGATCFSASVFNNLFFMVGLYIFFTETFREIIYPILGASILFNMVPETIVCVILGIPIVTAIQKSNKT